jgi:cell division protease FtsH
MEAGLGHVTYDADPVGFLGPLGGGFQNRRYSEETAREIDCAVRKIVESAHNRAVQILELNRVLLEEGAQELLAKETLQEQALKSLFARVRAADGESGHGSATGVQAQVSTGL